MDDLSTAARPGPFDTGPVAAKPEEGLAPRRDPFHDNQPPLEERILLEFDEDLDREGIKTRAAELLASAKRAPKCDSEEVAGAIGDLARMAGDLGKRAEAVREKHNRPILNAQRSMKAKVDTLLEPLTSEIARLRQDLNAFMAEQARKAREEQAQREREAMEARMAAAEIAPQLAEQIKPEPVAAPVARGGLGARVGTRKVWKHQIESVRQIPDRILKSARVVEAIDKMLAAEIRAGAREIKGVRIWSEDEAVVR